MSHDRDRLEAREEKCTGTTKDPAEDLGGPLRQSQDRILYREASDNKVKEGSSAAGAFGSIATF